MPARPSTSDVCRHAAPTTRTVFSLIAPLAVLLSCTAALATSGLKRAPLLPPCDSSAVAARLAERLEDIPALAGRGVTLLGIDGARRRGHAGGRSLRACQGKLLTSAGDGAIEYSIRAAEGGGFSVRPELFQGGWRERLLDPPELAEPLPTVLRRSRSARSAARPPRRGSASPAG